jgi:ABC-type ATPase involved in cell division
VVALRGVGQTAVATHDRELINRMGKRVIHLEHGRVIEG